MSLFNANIDVTEFAGLVQDPAPSRTFIPGSKPVMSFKEFILNCARFAPFYHRHKNGKKILSPLRCLK
jgi:hypothetical protein